MTSSHALNMTSNINDVTRCALCLADFHDRAPLVLPCSHRFCETCMDNIKIGTKIQCPKCSAFSDVTRVKPDVKYDVLTDGLQHNKPEVMPDLQQVLNTSATRAASTEVNGSEWTNHVCASCKLNVVAQWCEDCTQWMCDNCVEKHTKADATITHRMTSVSVRSDAILMSLREEQNKLESKVGVIENAQRKWESAIANAKKIEATALKTCAELRKSCHEDIDRYFDNLQRKISDFIEKTSRSFTVNLSVTQSKLKEIAQQKDALVKKASSKTTSLAIEGETLLKNAQTFVKSLTLPAIELKSPVVRVSRNLRWKDVEAATVEMHQTGIPQPHQNANVSCKNTLAQLPTKSWMRADEVELNVYYALRHIRQQLWCCCADAGIIVLDTDLQQQRTIPAGDMLWVNDVAEMSSGDVIIAAEEGLFHADVNGKTKHRILSAACSSVAVYQDQVYAVTRGDPRRVIIHAYSGSEWVKVHSFSVGQVGWITLSVKNNQIKCCLSDESKIMVYSLRGELLQTYGTRGSVGTGQLNHPYISSADDDGSVLIADSDNDRLQVMTEQGEFRVVQLLSPVSEPWGAVLVGDQLFVASDDKKMVYKYVCAT